MFKSFPVPGETPDLGKAKTFTGNGTPFLPVPGLKKVTSVAVGQPDAIIPLTEKREYPIEDGKSETRDEQLIDLQINPADGAATLLRSELSNDGIWQSGVSIFVTGEWDGDKPSKTKTEGE
jgi:hypothetical protein